MRKYIALFLALVMCLSLCACGGNDTATTNKSTATPSNDGAEQPTEIEEPVNLWSAQQSVDEFGDITSDSTTVIQTPISGDFSNTATSSSELSGYIFMGTKAVYPIFVIRLLEYGDTQATFTNYDNLIFKVKINDTIYEYEDVIGSPPNSDLVITDTEEILYTALYKGTDVRCIVEIGSSKYNFTICSGNFADLCKDVGYITKSIYFIETDNETLYNDAKRFIEEENFSEAIEILEYLNDYSDSKDMLLEVACRAYFSGVDRNTWKQFFSVNGAAPLTGEEIKHVIVGDWYGSPKQISTYTKDGKYYYTVGDETSDFNAEWYVEGDRLLRKSDYTSSEMTVYPFYKNAYVICTHQSNGGGNVYELYFHNGPLE